MLPLPLPWKKIGVKLQMCKRQSGLEPHSSNFCCQLKLFQWMFMVPLSSHQTKDWCWRLFPFQPGLTCGWDSQQPASHLSVPREKSETPLPWGGMSPAPDWRPWFAIELSSKSFTSLRPQQDSLKVDIRAIRLELGHCESRTFPWTAHITSKHNMSSALMISLLNNSVNPFS